MTVRLMPYGASRYAKLVAKVGADGPKRAPAEKARLAPYGSAGYGHLAAKAGVDQPKIEDARRRVLRLSKAGS